MTVVQKVVLALLAFTLFVKLPLFLVFYHKTKKNPFLPEDSQKDEKN